MFYCLRDDAVKQHHPQMNFIKQRTSIIVPVLSEHIVSATNELRNYSSTTIEAKSFKFSKYSPNLPHKENDYRIKCFPYVYTV